MSSGTDDFAVASTMSHMAPLGGSANRVERGHAAPIVIDVQNDFHAEGGMMEREGFGLADMQAMADRLPPSIPAARAAVEPVVFVGDVCSPEHDFCLPCTWLEQAPRARAGSHARREIRVADSRGGNFFGDVSPQPRDPVVTGHRINAFLDTDLDTILRASCIRTTAFTGVATSIWVETTVRDAFMRDCCVDFATGWTATWARGDHEATLCNIDRCFGEPASVAEVEAVWMADEC